MAFTNESLNTAYLLTVDDRLNSGGEPDFGQAAGALHTGGGDEWDGTPLAPAEPASDDLLPVHPPVRRAAARCKDAALLLVAGGLCAWQTRHAASVAHATAPVWACLAVMTAYHLCALPVTLGTLRGRSLWQMRSPLLRWIVLGFVAVALGQPQALPAALVAAFSVLVMVGRAARAESRLQDLSLRSAFRATLLITVWGLQVMLAASPVQLSGQLLPWLLAWTVALSPRAHSIVATVWDALERRRQGGKAYGRTIAAFWGLALGAIGAAALVCLRTQHRTSSLAIGQVVVQPYAFAVYAGLAAVGLRLSGSGRLRRWDWLCLLAVLLGFGYIRELGSPGMLLLAITTLVYVVTGVGPDFRWLVALLGLISAAVLGLSSIPVSGPGAAGGLAREVGSHLSHVRRRVDFLQGNPSLAELNRVELAVSRPGLLGRGGWARAWVLAKAAPKDYAFAELTLSLGVLGLLHVLVLYAVLFGALTSFCLTGRGYASARYVCLALTLGFVVQVMVSVGGEVEVMIAVGVPLLGIARGGVELFLFVTSWLALAAAERSSSPAPAQGPRQDELTISRVLEEDAVGAAA